jgi:hypothetical protein
VSPLSALKVSPLSALRCVKINVSLQSEERLGARMVSKAVLEAKVVVVKCRFSEGALKILKVLFRFS